MKFEEKNLNFKNSIHIQYLEFLGGQLLIFGIRILLEWFDLNIIQTNSIWIFYRNKYSSYSVFGNSVRSNTIHSRYSVIKLFVTLCQE